MNERLHPRLKNAYYLHLVSLRDALRDLASGASGVLVDYGCGSKPYRELFPNVHRYIGVDHFSDSADDILLPSTGILPLADDTADTLLSTQVLEHVPDVALYLRECYRVLKPGGVLILSTHGAWPYHPGPDNDDFWRWTVEGLRRQVESSQLKVTNAIGACRGAVALVQQALVLFDPAKTEHGRFRRLLGRGINVTVNISCLLFMRLFPRLAEAGDIVPIAVLVRAEKPATGITSMIEGAKSSKSGA